MKKFYPVLTVLFILQLVIPSGIILAVTKTSTQSGNWSASTTWGGNPAPVAGDDVIIDGGFTVTVDIPNAVCLSLQLGGSVLGAGTGTLAFQAGSQLTVTGSVNIGPVNNNGTAGSLNMAAGGIFACGGIISGQLGTWTEGTGTIEFTATNSVPSDNNIIFNNLTISGGTTSLSRNTTVNGNIQISSGATLDGGLNTLSLAGDLINNGTFTGNTGSVTFVKNGNQSITGTGIYNFNLIRVNMGTSIANTLEVSSTNFNAPDAFLTITNGTFKISGTFSFANTFFVGPAYNIGPTSGFWLNNPNTTVTAQTGDISVRGLLRLTSGTYNIGTLADNSLTYVAGSTINIEGGTLNIAGRLTRNNATATTNYIQSGGIVSVVQQGSTDPVFAGFDLGAAGSTFSLSGGTIVIRNATSAPADYLNSSSVATVTGGTLQLGDAGTLNGQIFRIQTTRPIGGLLLSNLTAQPTKPVAQPVSGGLTVIGNVSILPGTTLNLNGQNLSLGGNWLDNGTFLPGVSPLVFDGSTNQTLSNSSSELFTNLSIANASGVTMLSDVTVTGTLTLTDGALSIGSNTLTLNGSISTALGSFTGGNSSNIVAGGTGAVLAIPGVTLNNLTLNRANGCSIGGDVTVNGILNILSGTLSTGANNVILGPSATLNEPAGNPVSGSVRTTRIITSVTGTESFGNIGAELVMHGTSAGSTTILRKTGTASAGAGHNSIMRYFDITPSILSGLNADLIFHYESSELNGQTEANLELYRSPDNGTSWNNFGGTVNNLQKSVTVRGINDFGRFTAADNTNSLGTAAIPVTTSITPDLKSIGEPAFTLSVNGTGFVDGKSTVRFNGTDRVTTYINSDQLTISVPGTDLQVAGTIPVAVFTTSGGGLSNAQTFIVSQAIVTVSVETAADGSGSIVPTKTVLKGTSITVYAIARDVSNAFISNIAPDSWSLQNITGGILAGDLVPAADGKSATFSANTGGTAVIGLIYGLSTPINSGTITVNPFTGINDINQTGFILSQNYPNPFRTGTTISYQIPVYCHVTLKIFDMLGEDVATLVDRTEEPGLKTVTFEGGGLSGGSYYYRLQTGSFVETRKLLLLK